MPSDPLYGPGPRRVARGLLHLLLPACCLSCGEPLFLMGSLGLCAQCRGRLKPLKRCCAVCSGPLDAFEPPSGYRCGFCREHPPAFDRLLALWTYRPPLDAVVQALKFRRLDYLGRHLAQALAEELPLDGFDAVVPIPLHWYRRLTRGYNQAERIARPLAGSLGLPLLPALRRIRRTPPQTSLGKAERLANLRRAFRVRRPVQGLRLLLVDDVATTGATLEAAASVLKRAGAEGVTAVVAARTP